MHPFPTEEDLSAAAEKSSPARPTHPKHSALPAACAEVVIADAIKELGSYRDAWRFDDEDSSWAFYKRALGGRWTKAHSPSGAAVDRVGAFAREFVKSWCDDWQWPKEKTFSLVEYGDLGAHCLAEEWCRKGAHFYSRYAGHDDDVDFVFDEDTHAYIESDAFLDWAVSLPLEDNAWDKIESLRQAWPRRH